MDKVTLRRGRNLVEITLESQEANLVLSVGRENNWTSVSLVKSAKSELLGSEVLHIIAERLYNALNEPNAIQSSHKIDGICVKWILSLSELHSSFYCALESSNVRLFIIDCEGVLIHSFALSPKEVLSWINNLSDLRHA